MYRVILISVLFLFGAFTGVAQDTTVTISSKMFTGHQQIPLAKLKGWLFKAGDDTAWAKETINTKDWNQLPPTAITLKSTDKNGKIEGWFRLKFRIDSTLANMPLGLKPGTWAAIDVYLDGNFIQSFGNTGRMGNQYLEYNSYGKLPIPVVMKPEREHLLAIHFTDHKAGIPFYELRSETNENGFADFIAITGPEYSSFYSKKVKDRSTDVMNYLMVTLFISLFFILLTVQNTGEKILWYFTVVLLMLFSVTIFSFLLSNPDLPFNTYNIYYIVRDILSWLWPCICLGVISMVFKEKILGVLPLFILLFLLVAIIASLISRGLFSYRPVFAAFMGLVFIVFNFYILISSIKSIKGAKWIIMVAAVLTASAPILWAFLPEYERVGDYFFYLSLPIALIIYITQRFKEIFIEVQRNASEVLLLSEEKKDLLAAQNQTLEKQVAERTSDLNQSLINLKSTQSQLIQSEKMASLGQLTAGIAHEIQNPLNFVNNFSEVSSELVDEMNEKLEEGNTEDAKEIAADLKANLEKINHHGRRAGDIVKGMLQQSRASTVVKEPTDINALADEFLRLAYHGLRAKDKSFNVTLITDFDDSIGMINMIPQDIGRVILNLITNAFYVVDEKKKQIGEIYEPTIAVGTRRLPDKVLISVSDNGKGIPHKVLDKIFQPFFTTKPTGQGTGLGLSLSYDIVKAHGGDLKVETKEGEGSEFIIILPIV
jgi:two-component system NtrC family sensor kinase